MAPVRTGIHPQAQAHRPFFLRSICEMWMQWTGPEYWDLFMSVCVIQRAGESDTLRGKPLKRMPANTHKSRCLRLVSHCPREREGPRKQLWKTKCRENCDAMDVGGRPPAQTGKFRGNRSTIGGQAQESTEGNCGV